MSDVTTTSATDRESKFLSRALAAFAIAAAAKTDDIIAAQSVVDEFHDNGIDAFYFDRTEHIAYLVQSKWIKDGNGSPDLGSILKLIQGISHFLEDNSSQLGPKMQAKSADVQDSLSDSLRSSSSTPRTEVYAGLADTYNLMREFTSMPESKAYPRAIEAAKKAVALDDSLAEAHRALAFALFNRQWEIPEALRE